MQSLAAVNKSGVLQGVKHWNIKGHIETCDVPCVCVCVCVYACGCVSSM